MRKTTVNNNFLCQPLPLSLYTFRYNHPSSELFLLQQQSSIFFFFLQSSFEYFNDDANNDELCLPAYENWKQARMCEKFFLSMRWVNAVLIWGCEVEYVDGLGEVWIKNYRVQETLLVERCIRDREVRLHLHAIWLEQVSRDYTVELVVKLKGGARYLKY